MKHEIGTTLEKIIYFDTLKMFTSIVILLMLTFCGINIATARLVCSIDLDKRAKKNRPMILDKNGDIIYPTKSRKLAIGEY